MKVRELMTPNPTCADPETTVEEIATLMKEEDIGCVPVIDEDGEVAGVITDRDIVLRCVAEGKDPAECRADDVISPQSVTIGPNADTKEAARLMAERQIRRLPVVENGKLVGMLSLGDVAVKEHDDRLSGDVLQDVSEGVKTAKDARTMGAHLGGSRSGLKTTTADRAGAERSASRKKAGGPPAEELHEDARPSAPFESGIANRADEAAERHEKVIPFRDQADNRVRHEAMNRARNRKRVG